MNLLWAFKDSFFGLNPLRPTDLLRSLSITIPLPACCPIPNLWAPPMELAPPGIPLFFAKLPLICAPLPYPNIVLY